MACREDLDFHDDNKVVEKAKESIRRMKKKMILSHDLILQYNNKLKECDNLKGDLHTAQAEGSKLKHENDMNRSKVVKLESEIVQWKKSQLEFQQKIADQEIRIASDNSHLQQLICKLEGIESIHSGKLMEIDLQKSSLEVKIKELEQELKKLNKSHQVQIQKLEKTMNCPKVKRATVKNQIVSKVTIDVGINTDMPELVKTTKPDTADKIILTDEFYHIKDNPYPIFCDRCETLTAPNIDKICKIMTAHPPLLGEMLSPPRPWVSEKPHDLNVPLESIVTHRSQEPSESLVNVITPEIDGLKRKLATLERKMKKRNKEHSRESQPPSGNCCGHSCLSNCCNRASSTVPNVQMPNVQPDFMAEFWNRIMQCTNGSLPKYDNPQVQRKNSKRAKLLKLKKRKMKMLMKNKSNVSSTNWEIESDDCQNEIETTVEHDVQSNSDRMHILRLKPSEDTGIPTTKISRKKSTRKPRVSSPTHVDEFTEQDEEIDNESSHEIPIKIRRKPKRSKAFLFDDDEEIENSSARSPVVISKTNISQVSERRSSSRIQERKKLRSREITAKKALSTSEYLSASSDVDLGDEAPKLSRISTSKSRQILSEPESRDIESAYESQNSAINVSGLICEDPKHFESTINVEGNSTNDRSHRGFKNLVSMSTNDFNVTKNSTNNYSDSEIVTSHDVSQHDEDISDAPPEHHSDSDSPKCTRSFSVPEKNTRKRKRANSPKVTKRTSQSKLLRKLRALKKNSITIAAKGNPSIINVMPLSRQEISQEFGMENAIISIGNEATAGVPTAKKLRIAHVPKTASIHEPDIAQKNYVMGDNKNYHKNKSKCTNKDENISNARLNVSAEMIAGTNCAEDTEAKIPISSDVRRISSGAITAHSDEPDRSELSIGSAASSKTLARTKTTIVNEIQDEHSDDSKRDGSSLSSMGLALNSATVPREKSPITPGPRFELPIDADPSKLLPIESDPNVSKIARERSTIIGDLRAKCPDDSAASKLLPIDSAPSVAKIAKEKSTIISDLPAKCPEDSAASELLPIDSAPSVAKIAKEKSTIISDLPAKCPEDSAASELLPIESAPNVAKIARAKLTVINDLPLEHLDDSDGSKLFPIETAPNLANIVGTISTVINDLPSEHLDDSDGSKLLPIETAPNLANIVGTISTVINDLPSEHFDTSDVLKLSTLELTPSVATIMRAKSPIIGGLRSDDSANSDEFKLSSIKTVSSSATIATAKTTIIDELRTETSKQPDPHSVSPAALTASLHRLPRNLPVPPMPSRAARPIKTITTMNSEKNHVSKIIRSNQYPFIANTSLLTASQTPKPKEASTFSALNSVLPEEREEIPTCPNFSLDTTNTILPVSSTRTSVEKNESSLNWINSLPLNEESRAATHEQTLSLTDESPASPDASEFTDDHLSADLTSTDDLTRQSKNVQRHLSIYDQVELPIYEKIPTASTSSNIIEAQTAKIERPLLTYDPSIFANYDEVLEVSENLDSSMISNSQSFFAEAVESKKKNKRKKNQHGNLQNVVKDLRTRTVKCGDESVASQQNKQKIHSLSYDNGTTDVPIDPATYQRNIRGLGTLLSRHLAEAKKKSNPKGFKLRKAAATKLQIEAEKVVKTELDNLVNSEIWSNALQAAVIAKLRQASSPRTLSKSIVDFLIERAQLEEPLDRTHTPPAPVMTKTQQRIVTLITGIERDGTIPGVFELVMAGINFNLFKLGYFHQLEVIEQLALMFTILARTKKDRGRVRIMCCDAFYFLGRKVYTVIYGILKIWPEVLPNHSSQVGPLVKSMVNLLSLDESAKAVGIKRMLKIYYNYPEQPMPMMGLMRELMNELMIKHTGELGTAILLVSKREGTQWTYKNIVNGGLWKIVEEPSYPSLFNALSILGFLVRIFPVEDEGGVVKSVVEKLCEMMKSTRASPDQQEGVVAALLSISRHSDQFSKVADAIMPWKPPRPMRITTIEQLNVFFKSRAPEWWDNRKVFNAAIKNGCMENANA